MSEAKKNRNRPPDWNREATQLGAAWGGSALQRIGSRYCRTFLDGIGDKGGTATLPAKRDGGSDLIISREMVDQISKALADLDSANAAIHERMKKLEDNRVPTEDFTNLTRQVTDIVRMQEELRSKAERRIEFGVEDLENRTPAQLIFMPTRDERILDLQREHDHLYILTRLIPNFIPQRSEYYTKRFQPKLEALCRAMGTTSAGAGQEFIFTQFSNRLVDLVKKALRLADLFPHFDMPSDTFEFPLEGADGMAYSFSEVITDSPASGDRATAQTFGTGKKQLVAKDLAARSLWPKKFELDSVIAVLPYVERKMVRAFKIAMEQAIENGDTTAPHMDSDITTAKDPRKIWIGLRKATDETAKVDLSTFNLEAIMSLLLRLDDQYVDELDMLTFITSILGAVKLMTLKDSSGNRVVTTKDVLGDQAVIVKGYLGSLAGIPIVTSGYVRRDLNASGVYDGVTKTKTILQLVYRDAFQISDRHQYQVEEITAYREMLVRGIVASMSVTFDKIVPSGDKVVAEGYNISWS